jgi:uncharacterized protein
MGTGDILFGRTRAGILALLYEHSERSYFTREILRSVDAGSGAVQRELKSLLDAGLIVRRTRGNQVFYQADRESPIFPEMLALIRKTIGVFGVLRRTLEPLKNKIKVAFVYGSLARNEKRGQSDIDVMVLGSESLEEVLVHLANAESILARPINPTAYSVKEFRSKLKSKNHFLNAVLQGKKEFLIGSEHELGKLGRE